MKLAISNIAWDPLQDETVYSLMLFSFGESVICGIENRGRGRCNDRSS